MAINIQAREDKGLRDRKGIHIDMKGKGGLNGDINQRGKVGRGLFRSETYMQSLKVSSYMKLDREEHSSFVVKSSIVRDYYRSRERMKNVQ